MIELAIGDAYGAGFEYAPAAFVAEHNTVRGYLRHPTHTGIEPGDYTDDTQMTLAVAELLVEGADWTPLNLADRFVEVFHRDPRVGYAGGFHAFLRSVTSGREFLDRVRPDSDKSGAAMRVSPVGRWDCRLASRTTPRGRRVGGGGRVGGPLLPSRTRPATTSGTWTRHCCPELRTQARTTP